MSLLDGTMNLIKKNIFMGHQTMGTDRFNGFIKDASNGDLEGSKQILGHIQKVWCIHCRTLLWTPDLDG